MFPLLQLCLENNLLDIGNKVKDSVAFKAFVHLGVMSFVMLFNMSNIVCLEYLRMLHALLQQEKPAFDHGFV